MLGWFLSGHGMVCYENPINILRVHKFKVFNQMHVILVKKKSQNSLFLRPTDCPMPKQMR